MRQAGFPLRVLARRLCWSRFWRDQRGVSVTEYGLIIAGLACVIIASVTLVGTRVGARFDFITNVLRSS